jgi:hypothetical protein
MRRAAIGVGAWAAALCLAWIVFTRVTPPIVFREMLANGDEVTIAAGSRDTRFFAEGWPRLQHSPPVVTRVARGTRATIRIPLPDARDYDALVRVDPSTEPLRPGEIPAPIQLLLNGRLIGVCHSGSAPARMGFCRLRLPADGVRPGMNRLTLVTDEPNGFRVSLVRVTRAAS